MAEIFYVLTMSDFDDYYNLFLTTQLSIKATTRDAFTSKNKVGMRMIISEALNGLNF